LGIASRPVMDFDESVYKPGSYQFNVPAQAVLKPGFYFLQLQSNPINSNEKSLIDQVKLLIIK
jgi:hypothetical protein